MARSKSACWEKSALANCGKMGKAAKYSRQTSPTIAEERKGVMSLLVGLGMERNRGLMLLPKMRTVSAAAAITKGA